MNLSNLTTTSNLLLAWRRITTASNINYKQFFRPVIGAYELDLSNNLSELRRKIIDGEYEAKESLRIFMPTSSGLQRPITLLCLEDQIVLQALTNLFAEKIRKRREELEGTAVFSHLLNPHGSIFFVKEWQEGYFALEANLLDLFSKGNRWMATFDLSAFYATLDHNQLLRVISPRRGGEDLTSKAQLWFQKWSSNRTHYKHGIPQGPQHPGCWLNVFS
ncbi:MAG: hypothetical protein WD740_03335 [Anaerolineales bacterium]